ncbi:hypothetical protein EON65_11790 [archaeon]|nr:MAG: hypothetical protein EON65_11790 [archaeon]
MLLVVHADTYNAVLRQHHYRQKQLSSATSLLSELPLFRHHNYSKIASIAYTMRSQTYSSQSVLAKMGDQINNVLLIASGQVKVFAPPGQGVLGLSSGEDNQGGLDKTVAKRLPRLAVAMLGRGQIIGEVEMHKHSRTFLMTYETCAASTEVLEMPTTVFKESIEGGDFHNSVMYKSLETALEEREQRRSSRITRAYDAMVKMIEGRTRELKAKEEIMNILPVILDQTTLSGVTGSSPASPRSSKKKSATSKSVFPASQSHDNSLQAMSPLTPRKVNSIRSPRKLSFSSPVDF